MLPLCYIIRPFKAHNECVKRGTDLIPNVKNKTEELTHGRQNKSTPCCGSDVFFPMSSTVKPDKPIPKPINLCEADRNEREVASRGGLPCPPVLLSSKVLNLRTHSLLLACPYLYLQYFRLKVLH